MNRDDMIKTYMTAAGVLLEDLSTKLLLEPLGITRPSELRDVAGDLLRIADVVDATTRGEPPSAG